MAMKGMDVDAVKLLGDQMKRKGGDIETIIRDINSLVGQAQWEGPDAQRFRSDWQGTLQGQLKTVATALQGAGQSAMNNATEQEGVSNR